MTVRVGVGVTVRVVVGVNVRMGVGVVVLVGMRVGVHPHGPTSCKSARGLNGRIN